MGLLDIFGGGGDTTSGDAALYGGLLNQAQLAALNDRKWASLAGALAEAGMPSRLPIPIGSAIGQAAKAWSGAGDEGALKVLQIQKLAAETTNLKELAELRKTMSAEDKPLFDAITGALRSGAGGVPGGGPLATTGGGGAPVAGPGGGGARTASSDSSDPVEKFLDLTQQLESGNKNIPQNVVGPQGGYNPSTGTVTGPSSAQGYFQIINPTWRSFAPKAGVDLSQYPNAMSAPYEVQRAVARTIATTDGVHHWTDYNKNLRSAVEAANLPTSGPIASEQRAAAAASAPLPSAFNIPNFSGAGGLLGVPTDATPSQESGWANAVPDKFIYGRNNPKPQGPFYGEPGYQPPPQVAAAASGGGVGPVIPPGAGGDYGGGETEGRLPGDPSIVADNLRGYLSPGQGPLAIPRPAGLPPMPPPQAAPPVMQGPLAAPPPAIAGPAGPGPLAAPAAPPAMRPGPSYMPQMPGGDNQQLMLAQALIARQRMRAALAGISGDPYGGYADLLKNSPAALRQAEIIKQQAEYYGPNANPPLQGAIAGSRAQAETPEIFKRETQKIDEQIRLEGAKAGFNEQLDAWKQGRAAQLDFETVLVKNPETGRLEERKVPKSVLAQQFNPNAGAANITPGSDTGTAPPAGAKASDGVPPGGLNIVGKPVYPPDEEAKLKQVPTDYAKYLVENRLPVAQGAAQTLAFNGMARDLLDKGVFTGAAGSLKLQTAKLAQLLPGDWSNDRIANTETFLATQARQVASILASKAFGSGSSITDNDREYAAKIAGGDIKLDEASLRRLVDINERAARWEFDRYNDSVKTFDPEKRFDFLRVPDPVPLTLPGTSKGTPPVAPAGAAPSAAGSPGYNAVGPKGHKIYSVDGQKWYDATTNQPVN